MKKILILKFLILLNILFLSSSSFSNSNDPIKIGLLVPLSGKNEVLGKNILKSCLLAINKINDERIIIVPKDTKNDPYTTLLAAQELKNQGIKIIIGPVFNKNLKNLFKIEGVTFLSLTNKILGNPKNVIAGGINAVSQFQTMKKFLIDKDIKNLLILVPKSDFRNEIDEAISESKIKSKQVYFYDTNPTKLTKQIEKVTKYRERKKNLNAEIKRLKNEDKDKYSRVIKRLEKKDTLGKIEYDSILIADFNEGLKSVLTSLLYTDVNPKEIYLTTLNQWFDESLIELSSLHPIYFPAVNKESFQEFITNYKKNYIDTPDEISFISYDLVGLTYYLIRKNNYILDEKLFIDKNRFKGKVGEFKISKNKIRHELKIYKIENKLIEEIF
tara:strand:+ start:2533 stop:3690 length:1158 start_codon:yes stop_codon:yes gene_type:complete